MRTTRILAWIVVLSSATTVSAAPTVVVGSHPLLDNTPGQTIQLWVTGDGNLAGLNLFVQIGDGGPELAGYGLPAGTDGPGITAVNLQPLGGILSPPNASFCNLLRPGRRSDRADTPSTCSPGQSAAGFDSG